MTFRSASRYALLVLSVSLVLSGCGGGGSGTTGGGGSQPVATATTLSVSPNPAPAGTAVVLTASVTSSSGAPSGTVTFLDGSTSLGTAALSNGTASLSVTTFAAGSTHSLSASFGGSSTYLTSTSTAVSLTIQALSTTTTLSASPNPAPAGSAVLLTASVTASSGTPTGSVTFFDGTTTLGTGTLNNGVATLSVTTFAAGITHSLTASYGGATAFGTSTSAAVSLTVQAATTTTTLTVSPNPAPAGSTVVLTATVAASSGTASGTVTFLDGTSTLGTGTLIAGAATLSVTTFAANSTHSLTASFAASSSFGASTSAAVSLTVQPLPATTTTLTVSPNPAAAGASVTLTASVTAGSGTPTGSVTFFNGTTSLGSATLSAGTASISVTTFAPGSTDSLQATFGGSSTFATSTSAAVSLTVQPATTTTTLTASPNPAPANTAVVLSATVSSTDGTPTGTVTFYNGTTSLGTAALSGGVASLSVTTFTAGSTNSLTASFPASAAFTASTSAAVSLTIDAAGITANGSFSFTTPNQTISGFGGAEAFYPNYLDSHPNASQIYTALFDPVQGLGLTFLRMQNLYYLVGTNGNTASNFDSDMAKVVNSANAYHGTPLTLEIASWTPPALIKSNGNIVGGTLKTVTTGGTTGYDYADFATFWVNSLQAYAALGVTPNLISIQNEPDFNASYVSCLFNATEGTSNGVTAAGYDKAFAQVHSAINQAGALASPPQMIGPETTATTSLLAYATALETEEPSEVYALAHHLYNVSSAPSGGGSGPGPSPDSGSGLTGLENMEASFPNELKFETEYYDQPGFYTAWTIHNALTVGNDNAYFYWGLAWPSSPPLVNGQASDQQGLLYIDNPFNTGSWQTANGWTYNDAYYAFKHFSYFIKPGYIRYNATLTPSSNTDERLSVYQSPDQKTTVIVVLNTSAFTTDVVALNVGNITYTASTVYLSTFSEEPISSSNRWVNMGAYSTTNNLTLPPEAVATIVLTQ